MMHYRDWTAIQVRDWIEEAAITASLLPGGLGPRGSGNAFPETVREKWKDAAPNEMPYRPRPSSTALSRMESAWAWINALPMEEERRLLYGWSAAKASKRRKLRYFAEENSVSERTLLRLVNRVCQGIADTLNRKHAIRLSEPFDSLSEQCDGVHDFSVSSGNCAKVAKQPRFERFTSEKLHHDSSPEATKALGKHLAAINRRRRNQARRKAERVAKRQQREAA